MASAPSASRFATPACSAPSAATRQRSVDYGTEDPFRVYDEGFVEAMEAGSADFTAHSWPGAHEGGYWNEHWPDYQRFYVKALAHCG
ncbi:MAG TPA: hypothetical protein VNS60_03110 [Solirubrobacterales bacterium]|nr:hypothetical protein [Solirubrobacterales bacterium]